MNIPENLKYTKTHEWIKVAGDVGICGISDYAQSELSDIVFISVKDKGTVLSQGEAFGTIEGVKAVSDVYSPVSGEIIEANAELTSSPQIINEDPYGKGWIMKIKIAKKEELDNLLTPVDYVDIVGKSTH